jgi:predicted small secreted protein
MKKLIAAMLAAGLLFATAGCNTMQGLGKDVEIVGEKIQKKAK